MNHKLLTLALSASLSVGWCAQARNISPQAFSDYVNGIAERANSSSGRSLMSDMTSSRHRIVTNTDGSTSKVSYWSSLFTPTGEEWIYIADYDYETVNGLQSIKGADFTIYDSNLVEYKKLHADFELGENETAINSVQINPWLSKKFFNINEDYEVMVYVHATTKDYMGHNYNKVYTLSDGSLVTTIEGNNINATNTARDQWSENFHMVFMRENLEMISSEDDFSYEYTLYFDVYKKAGWSTDCELEHTFVVDYSLISGAGDAALPILISQDNGKLYYALPRYEKPYFVSSMSEDITPDNNFIVDLYDQNFNLVKTTTIPMDLEEGAIFSFPGLGSFTGNKDIDFTLFADGSGLPCYIVGVENYIKSTDDYSTSLYVYDTDGRKLKTIAINAEDYLHLTDIKGFESQWCFLYSDDDETYFSMLDIPSCKEAAKLPATLDGTTISTSLDRTPQGLSYQYVSSILTADSDSEGNAIHKLAWFNADGIFDRYTEINLGQSVALAMVYVSGNAFDPYIFNTDDKIEYMFLVKKYRMEGSSLTDEFLRIYNEDSELLLEIGPDSETGEILNAIFLMNADANNTKLVTCYYGYEGNYYTVRHFDLPLSKFGGGSGTIADPYLISQPGDLMAVASCPSAHYVIDADLDFHNLPWSGNECVFTGSLDGRGHTISNLALSGNGIFSDVNTTYSISNINFKDATILLPETDCIGLIANEFVSGSTKLPSLYNINVDGLYINSDSKSSIGGLIGHSAVMTSITLCSIENAEIIAPNAVVGGFVGEAATSSAVTTSAFSGKIVSDVAGGIFGESLTGDEHVDDCHVTADIIAEKYAGGIIGESKRTRIRNCVVNGSVSATGANETGAGGLVGRMAALYSEDKTIVLEGNIVAATVEVAPAAERAFAHRILGYSSGDELLINWESKDPAVNWDDPSTYPYISGKAETMLGSNYALDINVVDASVADDHSSLEGKSISMSDLTADFLNTLGFKLGENEENPWCLMDKGMKLFFEDGTISGIDRPSLGGAALTFTGSAITGNGLIKVYDMGGIEVACGNGFVSTLTLPKGVYMAVGPAASVKFAVR